MAPKLKCIPPKLKRLQQFINGRRRFQQIQHEVQKLESYLKKKEKALEEKQSRRDDAERFFNQSLEWLLRQRSILVSTYKEFEVVAELKQYCGWTGSVKIFGGAKRSDRKRIVRKAGVVHIGIIN